MKPGIRLGTELGKRRKRVKILSLPTCSPAGLLATLAGLACVSRFACWTSGKRQRSKWGGWLEEKMMVEMEGQAVYYRTRVWQGIRLRRIGARGLLSAVSLPFCE